MYKEISKYRDSDVSVFKTVTEARAYMKQQEAKIREKIRNEKKSYSMQSLKGSKNENSFSAIICERDN
ncbi:MAG: hypothetical protein LBR74_09870 [Eubacterium sp.]|jgi:hypothetical protein|nr:hypothetical protein [Eubacterium sp.]